MEKDKYNPKLFENKWRKIWEDSKIYEVPNDFVPKNKYYILPQLPYPSGSGLHMGHSEVYTGCDILARYKRLRKFDVLQVIGWDAFGLPAENYAIKTNIHPRKNTDSAIDNFREQIKSLGISVDWSREVGSHNPDYYKWTQWFFLLMYKRGLAYRANQTVNWCPNDKTVLANEQVTEKGTCERCGATVELKKMKQWYLKITDYAERLYNDLDKVDWPAETIKRQRDWIGKSSGAIVKFKVLNYDLEVFTTRPDTLFGVSFLVVSPEHEVANLLKGHIKNYNEVENYVENSLKKTELERLQQKEKTGVLLEGIYGIHPFTGEQIPIFVADYVLSSYGTGAIMGVPAHDERDFEFAQKFNLLIKRVIDSDQDLPFEGDGKLVNSDFLNGLSVDDAKEKIIAELEKNNLGYAKITYKLRDWSVSRQRFWGAPIPIVYDPDGNPHPVKDDDLPVLLPDDVDFMPTGQSPLTYSPSFQDGVEEKYGKGWRREVDTLDTFMCSSWYYFRYIDPQNDEAFASQENLKKWMPVDFYLGGPEHVNGHLLYSRFFTKVLFDEGIIDFDEPFLVHRHQGLVKGPDGRKMSKRWGNVINPTDVIEKYGADTVRTYLMFMGPLEQDKAWNDRAVAGVHRFLSKVWNLQYKVSKDEDSQQNSEINKLIAKITQDMENMSFNTYCAKLMEFSNFLQKCQKINQQVWEEFLILLSPTAPFLSEELWSRLGYKDSIHTQKWPDFDNSQIVDEVIEIAVQINGKSRGIVQVRANSTQDEVWNEVLKNPKFQNYLSDKPQKIIFVPNKIISIVV
ncbi:MAG: leucine--tRNA ligase [Candidatus Dojkabacteria bacterium]|nr:MAG: leucine--tRNA ligase [Candidatus Dojkabacteria bacterium]